MDFSQVKLFGKKNFSDLLKEIHTNQKDKETQLRSLIEGLKPLITSPGEATMIVPLIKEYMELAIKNDDALIKMAGIVQRAMNSKIHLAFLSLASSYVPVLRWDLGEYIGFG